MLGPPFRDPREGRAIDSRAGGNRDGLDWLVRQESKKNLMKPVNVWIFSGGYPLHSKTMARYLQRGLAAPVGFGTLTGLIGSGVGAWISSPFSGAARIGVWGGATAVLALLLARGVGRAFAALGSLADLPGRSPLSKRPGA